MPRLRDPVLRAGREAHYHNPSYYDQTYRLRREDVTFYLELARRARGPVLELGVGSGRVAQQLAREGVDILGVDASTAMLKHARERRAKLPAAAQRRWQLRQADLRSFRSRRRFALVIAPFNTFMHLYTRRDWERALATARKHLQPRGKLAFDVLLPDPAELARDPDRLYRGHPVRVPGQPHRYRYGETFEYDPVSQVQLVTMHFDAPDPHQQDSFITPLCQRQCFPAELDMLLHYNGWQVRHRYGDFEKGKLDDASLSQVIIAAPKRIPFPT